MKKDLLKLQKKIAQERTDGSFGIRVSHVKQKGKKGAHYIIRCGCCDEKFEIFYDDDTLEINGVNGSIENWREILLPLLDIKKK